MNRNRNTGKKKKRLTKKNPKETKHKIRNDKGTKTMKLA